MRKENRAKDYHVCSKAFEMHLVKVTFKTRSEKQLNYNVDATIFFRTLSKENIHSEVIFQLPSIMVISLLFLKKTNVTLIFSKFITRVPEG